MILSMDHGADTRANVRDDLIRILDEYQPGKGSVVMRFLGSCLVIGLACYFADVVTSGENAVSPAFARNNLTMQHMQECRRCQGSGRVDRCPELAAIRERVTGTPRAEAQRVYAWMAGQRDEGHTAVASGAFSVR